jgi:hypothetical protein
MADNDQIMRWGPCNQYHATAQAVITPGDLIEVIPTAGADLGKVRRHSTAAARAAPLFADGNWQFGKGADDNYAAGDTVPTLAPSAGARIFARCAIGVAITKGSPLESAGNGLLRPATTGVIVAEAMEDESTVGEPTPGRLLVRIVAQ